MRLSEFKKEREWVEEEEDGELAMMGERGCRYPRRVGCSGCPDYLTCGVTGSSTYPPTSPTPVLNIYRKNEERVRPIHPHVVWVMDEHKGEVVRCWLDENGETWPMDMAES